DARARPRLDALSENATTPLLLRVNPPDVPEATAPRLELGLRGANLQLLEIRDYARVQGRVGQDRRRSRARPGARIRGMEDVHRTGLEADARGSDKRGRAVRGKRRRSLS